MEPVRLAHGSLYLGRALCERCFAAAETVILLRRGDDLLILPVHDAAAGGFLLKRRNAAGDRVVTAPEFFRGQGLDDAVVRRLDVRWSEEAGALEAPLAFVLQT